MIKFRHVCILVRNIEKAKKWYQDNFGFTLFNECTIWGEYPETILGIEDVTLTYAKLKLDDFILELIKFDNPKIKPKMTRNHIAFTVDDLDKTYKILLNKGVGFISPPTRANDSKCKVCFCMDLDNNFIELVQE